MSDSIYCEQCGESGDIYRCDYCNICFCSDCSPYRDDDAPIDVCESCMCDEQPTP